MRSKAVIDRSGNKRLGRAKRESETHDRGAEAQAGEAGVTHTIERRFTGKLTGGLLDRWHAQWLDWHVWLKFKSKAERDKKLRSISRDSGWHVENFEYREGIQDAACQPQVSEVRV